MEANNKLEMLLDYTGLKILPFSKSIGQGSQTFYDIRSGKIQSFTVEVANKIIKAYPEINKEWLIADEPNMLRQKPDKKADVMDQLARVQKKNGKNESKAIKDTIFNTVEAYILPIKGRLGLGSSYYADDYFDRELDKTTVSITEKPLNANRFVIAEFEGDSMTNGEPDQIPDGSWLILAERKRGEDWESNMEGKIMGFYDRDDNFTVKRVKKHDSHFGYVVLEALNPDKSQPENQDRELQIKNCWAIYDYINKLS